MDPPSELKHSLGNNSQIKTSDLKKAAVNL